MGSAATRTIVSVCFVVGIVVSACSDGETGATTCPARYPGNGVGSSGSDACGAEGLECSYPLSSKPSAGRCGRRIATCHNGAFTVLNSPCQSSTPCPPSAPQNGSSCTFACSTGCANGPCGYPKGVICACGFSSPEWSCTPPVADGCPDTMPDLGTACSPEGLDCNYGECGGFGWHERCSGGYWVHVHDQCAP